MVLPIAYEARLKECGIKHLALYQSIRDAIADELLKPGERLPSTRDLAGQFGLSRGIASLAYEMLSAEGFVRAGVGQGTFVAGADEAAERAPRSARSAAASPALSAWGERLAARERKLGRDAGREAPGDDDDSPAHISFEPQGIGQERFPWTEWKAVLAARWKRIGGRDPDELGETEGSVALRRAIAGRLRRERGIRCEPIDVIVTGGSMQAIALLCQLLLEEGRTAVVENPGYGGIRQAVLATGAQLIAEDVDRQGIVPRDWQANLLFVTPTRHYPTGAVLTYERRLALLEWAACRDAFIVEDDFDSDFRWGGRPIEPLKALDRDGRVVYVGTFSRSMRPEIRIGYAVVPASIREAFVAAKRVFEPQPTAVAEQRALADWMAEGGYDRHLRRLRRLFGKLEALLRQGLEERLGDRFEVWPSDAGVHLYAVWKGTPDEYEALVEECRKKGVRWMDGAKYYAASKPKPPAAIFGFAHLDRAEIEEGIARIRQAADELSGIGNNRRSGGQDHA